MEGANKYFGTRVCVSESVANEAPSFTYRPVGDVIFKGKTDPIRCLEPVSPDICASVDVAGYAEAFEQLGKDDCAAAAAFQNLHDGAPQDRLIQFHLQRLQAGDRGKEITLSDK